LRVHHTRPVCLKNKSDKPIYIEPTLIQCSICGKDLASKQNLKNHEVICPAREKILRTENDMLKNKLEQLTKEKELSTERECKLKDEMFNFCLQIEDLKALVFRLSEKTNKTINVTNNKHKYKELTSSVT
jgi:predicted nuclease with TOPRIM domain